VLSVRTNMMAIVAGGIKQARAARLPPLRLGIASPLGLQPLHCRQQPFEVPVQAPVF
jgi:hypothetical protein